jgi:hypothetical protein
VKENKDKTTKKYVTLRDGGCDFRKMSKIMTKAGYKMNHATARNQLMLAIETLITHTSSKLKMKLAKSQVRDMVTSQDLQNNLADVLFLVHEEILQEEAEKKTKKKEKGANRTKGKNDGIKKTKRK